MTVQSPIAATDVRSLPSPVPGDPNPATAIPAPAASRPVPAVGSARRRWADFAARRRHRRNGTRWGHRGGDLTQKWFCRRSHRAGRRTRNRTRYGGKSGGQHSPPIQHPDIPQNRALPNLGLWCSLPAVRAIRSRLLAPTATAVASGSQKREPCRFSSNALGDTAKSSKQT